MASFDYFIVFAEMRTGSNLLETCLNALPGVSCHGELFNPHFVGRPKASEAFGVSKSARERDPLQLIAAMCQQATGLPGFRCFHDHDVRVMAAAIADPKCAKIILTRNPLDAHISRKIAAKTNQWRLADMKDRKNAQVTFDLAEFTEYLNARSTFQQKVRRDLQIAGQTAFDVTYEDIQRVETLNGIARFLGKPADLKALPRSIKKQNPGQLSEKVSNFTQMQQQLAGFEWLDLDAAPDFEPARGPGVPGFIAAADHPLIFLPLPGGPIEVVADWMGRLDGGTKTGFNQKTLREWMQKASGHRSFTVLRHPLARAFFAFYRHIWTDGPDSFGAIRSTLAKDYGVAIPAETTQNTASMKSSFEGFLRFLAGNLAGQTSIRVDPVWATQAAIIDGFGRFIHPDTIIREADLMRSLDEYGQALGLSPAPIRSPERDLHAMLGDLYDADLEKLARRAYRRDYLIFGFEDYKPG